MRLLQRASCLLPVLVIALSAALAPRAARADEETPASSPATTDARARDGVAEPEPAVPKAAFLPPPAVGDAGGREWYGDRNLEVDGVAVALMFGGPALDSGAVLGAGVLGYVLGSPIVHGRHGNFGRALGSVALRLGLPLLGAAIGANEGCRDGVCIAGVGVPIAGVLAGVGSAILIDDLFLAREDARPAGQRVMAPVVAPAPGGGMSFGLAGTF